uniref:Endonuclease-reverse transcriptase n=1 Tax=Eptatretus burgeri TaxID=7764 RepID=A0A8C4Q5Z7_EPTBU
MDSLDHGVWRCRYLCGRTKVRVFRSLVLPVLLYACETWTLTKDLRRRLNSFGTRSLRRILGYRWSDFVSNERLLRETRMRFVTCIVRERQFMDMWLVFLTLILLTRFSQRGSFMSGGGQWADHMPHGCNRLTIISRRWGWAWHLPGGWPDGGPWSTGGKWTQRRAVLAHAPIPDLTYPSHESMSH